MALTSIPPTTSHPVSQAFSSPLAPKFEPEPGLSSGPRIARTTIVSARFVPSNRSRRSFAQSLDTESHPPIASRGLFAKLATELETAAKEFETAIITPATTVAHSNS